MTDESRAAHQPASASQILHEEHEDRKGRVADNLRLTWRMNGLLEDGYAQPEIPQDLPFVNFVVQLLFPGSILRAVGAAPLGRVRAVALLEDPAEIGG